jgi:hypothetical protein
MRPEPLFRNAEVFSIEGVTRLGRGQHIRRNQVCR